MQNSKHFSYCPPIRSELTLRHSCPGTYKPFSTDNEKPQTDAEKIRRLSNTSLSSNDSGVGFSKADYEIQRALKAQRILQRPHIIVLHKGKPIYHSTVKNLNNNHEEFEANIVVAAATASKRNRREISVMHKRQTIVSVGNTYYDKVESLGQFSRLKNNSAPDLYKPTQMITKDTKDTKEVQNISQEEQKEKKEIKDKLHRSPSFMPKPKLLFKSVSLSIKKLMGVDKEKKRRSQLIKQIRHQPKFI